MLRYILALSLLFPYVSYAAKYLTLPDGSSVEVPEGMDPQLAWFRAMQKFPEAFGLAPSEEKILDIEYLNSCKQKAASNMKSAESLGVALQVCRFKAVPKMCRAFDERSSQRQECVKQCASGSTWSKTFGDCSHE